MAQCIDCGGATNTYYSKIGPLCDHCYQKRDEDRLEHQAKKLSECSDFKTWTMRDMSELFWLHLGRYVKEPNAESFRYMEMAYRWACHADHGLSNSFNHAMRWANIDMFTECERWATKT